MADWIVRPGGRIVRFRNRQVRHWCSRRRHGRPVVGNGPCYIINVSRLARRRLAAQLRRQLREQADLADVALVVPRSSYYL
jgi:hypothetical protein